MKPHYLQTDCKHNFQTTLTANIAPLPEYFDANGMYRGITADYHALIEKKLGISSKRTEQTTVYQK